LTQPPCICATEDISVANGIAADGHEFQTYMPGLSMDNLANPGVRRHLYP
jgi:hypothetical protein